MKGNLGKPASLADGVNTFTRKLGLHLAANTTYFVVVDVGGAGDRGVSVVTTTATAEDAGSLPGWTVGDGGATRATSISGRAGTWTTGANIPKFAVLATANADTAPPTFSRAAINGATLTVTFNEILEPNSLPAPGDFAVSVAGSPRNVVEGGVAISGATVTLTLESAVLHSDTALKVGYTRPAANPLRDPSGNPVATFTDRDVSNDTPSEQPPTSITLVANTAEADQATPDLAKDWALLFSTGPNADGYKLTSIDIPMVVTSGNDPTYTVAVYSRYSSSVPNALLATLTNPATLTNGLNTFTAPGAGVNLDPNEQYAIVLSVTADAASNPSNPRFRTASTDEEDGAAGWSIGDLAVYFKTRDSSHWLLDASQGPGKLAVKGYARNLQVSNLAQSAGTNQSLTTSDVAGSFTTGAEPNGYALTKVQIEFDLSAASNTTEPTYNVHVRQGAANGPSVGTLTNPASLAAGVNTFTAGTTEILLATGTAYFVVVDVSAAGDRGVSVVTTAAIAEDAGSLPGWTVNDDGLTRAMSGSGASGSWTFGGNIPRIAVLGTVNTDSPPPSTDTTPPAFSSARVDGIRLKVTFDEDLDPDSAPDGSAFHIFGVDPSIVGTGPTSIEGNTVSATLERAVPPRATVSLSYLIPDVNPLQDAAGNEAPGFGPNPMTNNTNTTSPAFVRATFKVTLPEPDEPEPHAEPNDCTVKEKTDGNELTVIFNEELDPAFAPAGSAFTMREQGGSRVIAVTGTAVIDGNKVTVMLAEAPEIWGVSWRVSYVRPSGNGLRDHTGQFARNFSNRPATFKPSGKTVICGAGDHGVGDSLGDDTLYGGPGNDRLFANSGDDVLYGGPGNDRLYGDAHGSGAVGNDTLNGGPGHDYLVGGPGADNLDGGQPDHPDDATDLDHRDPNLDYGDPNLNYYESVSDWFLPGDTASYWWSPAGVTVNLSADAAELRRAGCAAGYDGAGKGGNAEGDCLTGIENIVGSEHRDNLMGSRGPNLLRGGDRADVLDGFDGHVDDAVDYRDSNAGVKVDLYVGGGDTAPYGRGYCNTNSNDRRCGFAGSDTIRNIRTVHGSNHYDGIIGDDKDNTLYGHGGNDELKGEGGADTLHGGPGNDTASYATSDAGVNVNLDANTASGGHAEGDTLIRIENLTGSPHDDTLAGNDLPNVLDGGGGSDTADYSRSGAAVTINLAANTADGGHASRDTLISIENVTGSPHDDTIIANSSDNVIDGGPGFDVVRYDGPADSVEATYNADGTAVAAVSGGQARGDTLLNVELVTGPAVVILREGRRVNVMTGTNGDDDITGTAGDDNIYGLSGNDTLKGDPDPPNDGATGNASHNGIDFLFGGPGDDTLEGGPGADVINGGPGIDTAWYDGPAGSVTVSRDANGNYSVSGGDAQGDVLIDIERVAGPAAWNLVVGTDGDDILTGTPRRDRLEALAGNDELYGLADDDSLDGGPGNDLLRGGPGADELDGGDGNDTADYSTSDAYVVINLNSREPRSGGHAEGDTLRNIENVIGSPGGDLLRGDSLANVLRGGDGVDNIYGGGGDDELYGGPSVDALNGNAGNDTLDGGPGSDTLRGNDRQRHAGRQRRRRRTGRRPRRRRAGRRPRHRHRQLRQRRRRRDRQPRQCIRQYRRGPGRHPGQHRKPHRLGP